MIMAARLSAICTYVNSVVDTIGHNAHVGLGIRRYTMKAIPVTDIQKVIVDIEKDPDLARMTGSHKQIIDAVVSLLTRLIVYKSLEVQVQDISNAGNYPYGEGI